MTGRVPWGTYSGDDIETVVAMMLNREHPNSVRIAASQGDGGVDIVDRGAGPDGGDVVYQVKRFTGPLTSDHKSKVKKSLKTLWCELHDDDGRWAHLNMTSWQLITVSEPSPESDKWFAETLMDGYDVEHSVWHSLELIEQLAAKYNDVIDYYLRDGKDRVLTAFSQAISLAPLGKPAADVTPAAVGVQVGDVVALLNDNDPHYQYTIRAGAGEPDPPPARARYMFTEYTVETAISSWHAVDVFARCAHSPIERPITGKGELTVKGGTDFAQAYQEHLDYGVGFVSPLGAFSGSLDGPGGLGGDISDAQLHVFPVPDQVAEPAQLRMEILNLDGDLLGEAIVNRRVVASGKRGIHVSLSEVSGVFELTMQTDFADRKTVMRFSFGDPTGKSVTAIRPVFDFLANFKGPNTLRTSMRDSPPHLGPTHQLPDDAGGGAEAEKTIASFARVCRILWTIQQHTVTVVRMPAEENVRANLLTWQMAAYVLEGKTAYGTIADDYAFYVQLDRDVPVPAGPFELPVPLRVTVGEDEVDLGTMVAVFGEHQSAGDPVEVGDQLAHPIITSDRKVHWRPIGTGDTE